jgi:hypothetical protein
VFSAVSFKLLAWLFQAILAETTALDSALAEDLASALQAVMTETNAQLRAALPTLEEMAVFILLSTVMMAMLALPISAIQLVDAISPTSPAIQLINAKLPAATLLSDALTLLSIVMIIILAPKIYAIPYRAANTLLKLAIDAWVLTAPKTFLA